MDDFRGFDNDDYKELGFAMKERTTVKKYLKGVEVTIKEY